MNTITKIEPWFEMGFDEALKATILAAWPLNATLGCQGESSRWAKRLLTTNPELDLEIHEGFYYVEGETDEAEGHTWLVIDGCIFDPTAAQFDGEACPSYYEAHIHIEGDDLLKHLGLPGTRG